MYLPFEFLALKFVIFNVDSEMLWKCSFRSTCVVEYK